MLRKALWVFLKPLIQLITNLLNPEVGEEWLTELKKFLRKETCWIAKIGEVTTKVANKTLKVWKTINVGGTTTEELLKSIVEERESKEKNEVGNWARDITTKPAFVISSTRSQVGLVVLTPANLGFTVQPRTDAFMTKEFCAEWSAKYLDGYVIELCEGEDGPQLRLQYQDQPTGEILWMAMKGITSSGGGPRVFRVERRGGGLRWLSADWSYPDGTWRLDRRIVFRFRKLPLPSAI